MALQFLEIYYIYIIKIITGRKINSMAVTLKIYKPIRFKYGYLLGYFGSY